MVRDALALDDGLTGAVPGTAQGSFRAVVGPEIDGDGTDVELVAENDTKIPFFGWFFALVFRFEIRRALKWAHRALKAAGGGSEAPEPLGTHPLSTPGTFDGTQAQLIATVAFAGASGLMPMTSAPSLVSSLRWSRSSQLCVVHPGVSAFG